MATRKNRAEHPLALGSNEPITVHPGQSVTSEYIVRRVGENVLRLQSLIDGVIYYFHGDGLEYAENEIVMISVTRCWTLVNTMHFNGEVVRTRVDLDAIHIEPKLLEEVENGNYAFHVDEYDGRLSNLIDVAADHIRFGRSEKAAEILHRILDSEPSCIDAYNHLGLLAERDSQHELALRYYRIAYLIGMRSIPSYLPGEIPWCYPPNRPTLRAVHGYGLELWRTGKSETASDVLKYLLLMDESNPFDVRSLLDDIESGFTPFSRPIQTS